jgi:4-diphosphocytidyl-2-C-methyl-D-erythritol kinase
VRAVTRDPSAGRLFLGLPAPAKLNLFLHVVGRRNDGYHELQSVFVPIDLADLLDFELRADAGIERTGDLASEPAQDLCVRAARALQAEAGVAYGVSIHVDKRIPAGSGMGGGSSDAATTLIALNRLWDLGWPRARLARIGARLGADVPFFLGPGPAFVEGIGERITPLEAPGPGEVTRAPAHWPRHCAVIWPQVHVSTAEIFNDPGLTRHTKLTTISAFSAVRDPVGHDESGGRSGSGASRALFGVNDLEAVVRRHVPEVGAVLEHLSRFGPARMTGSGSAAFGAFDSEDAARAAIIDLPDHWSGWVTRTLDEHPLAAW